MTSGLRPETTGSELQPRVAQAVPVAFSPLAGAAGDDAEDALARAGRRRLRWQIGFAVALAFAVASFAIVIVSSVYEARASVLIRPPGGQSGVPQAVGGALQSEVEILRSFEVLRQALESIRVEVLYPGLEGETTGALRAAAVTRMREALAVRTLPDSDVIEVTFRHADAQLAADVVNRLVERFQRSRREMLAPAVSRRLLHERIGEQREVLAAAETALAAFHAEHPELAAPDTRRELADHRLALEAELRTQRDVADDLRSAAGSEDASVLRARGRLDELELELQATLNTHVDGSRAVSKLRSEIGRVREFLAEKERAATQGQARKLELLRSRQLELEAQLAALGEAERALPELELRGRDLARERDVASRRLDAYQRELEAATLAADVGEQQLAVAARVLEPAQPPMARMIPAESARRAWALLGGAVLVLVGVFVTDELEQRRARRQPPAVWTAHVPGAECGAVSLLMPRGGRGADGTPLMLLLSGAPPAPDEDRGRV